MRKITLETPDKYNVTQTEWFIWSDNTDENSRTFTCLPYDRSSKLYNFDTDNLNVELSIYDLKTFDISDCRVIN